MSERPPPDSKPDVAKKSEPPPAKPSKPALPERVNTIDIMTGTLLGAHLPPLLEEMKKEKEAAAAAEAPAQPAPAPPAPVAPAAKVPEPALAEDSDEPPEPALSPLTPSHAPMGSRWLTQLRSPQRLAALAVGGIVIGGLLTMWIGAAARGCSGGGRVDRLERRVSFLEQKLGVSSDPAAASSAGDAGKPTSRTGIGTDAVGSVSSSSPGADDPKKAKCALAKVAAYQAWQDAVAKAKVNAAPAEAPCADMWTQAKKQACYYNASQGVRTAQAARDAVMKGGSAARESVKNVKDDPKNEAITAARAASGSAFDACQDDNEF